MKSPDIEWWWLNHTRDVPDITVSSFKARAVCGNALAAEEVWADETVQRPLYWKPSPVKISLMGDLFCCLLKVTKNKVK